MAALTDPSFHGGRNNPEQVTEEYLCYPPAGEISAPRDAPTTTRERMHHKSAVSWDVKNKEYPPGGVRAMSRDLFKNTQVDRLLRRHNQWRRRNDTWYCVPCEPVPSTAWNLTHPRDDGRFGGSGGGWAGLGRGRQPQDPEASNIGPDPCVGCCKESAITPGYSLPCPGEGPEPRERVPGNACDDVMDPCGTMETTRSCYDGDARYDDPCARLGLSGHA